MLDNLSQRIANMEFQLTSAREHGELEQFIYDQHKDLERLLNELMWALQKQSAGAA